MKISMYIYPGNNADLDKEGIKPVVTEEDGVVTCFVAKGKENIALAYLSKIGNSFEKRVKKLQELKEKGEDFFDYRNPDIIFRLTE